MSKDEAKRITEGKSELNAFVRWRKPLLWVPYVLSQVFLVWLVVWLGLFDRLEGDDQMFAGAMIALYGGFCVCSRDIRHRYWPKKDK